MGAPKTVAEIMTKDVITLLEEDNLEQVTANLARFRFRHMPVVDDGKLVGMLSQRDMLRATVAGVDQSAFARARESRFLERTFVRDVMQTQVASVRPETNIAEAAGIMLRARIGALPVVDAQGNLVGIVTENDMLRLVAG
jgi:CBS domain-containing membrane protein